jgi:hypothetical protein
VLAPEPLFDAELLVVAGAAALLLVLSLLLLPPHAASPIPRTTLQAPARRMRLIRFMHVLRCAGRPGLRLDAQSVQPCQT